MTVAVIDLDTAWRILCDDPGAVLVDVRTEMEWSTVGVPDLSSIGKEVQFIEWQFPDGRLNPEFLPRTIRSLDPTRNTLVLCRSGARSQAAAEALEEAGFACTHNVVPGYEGPVGPDGRRDNGWKASLPWAQH